MHVPNQALGQGTCGSLAAGEGGLPAHLAASAVPGSGPARTLTCVLLNPHNWEVSCIMLTTIK